MDGYARPWTFRQWYKNGYGQLYTVANVWYGWVWAAMDAHYLQNTAHGRPWTVPHGYGQLYTVANVCYGSYVRLCTAMDAQTVTGKVALLLGGRRRGG
jgi:hypothetical protein